MAHKSYLHVRGDVQYISSPSGRIYRLISRTPLILKRTHEHVNPLLLRRRGAWQRAHPWSYTYPRWLQI